MENQLIGTSKEAKVLYDIYKYFATIERRNIEEIEDPVNIKNITKQDMIQKRTEKLLMSEEIVISEELVTKEEHFLQNPSFEFFTTEELVMSDDLAILEELVTTEEPVREEPMWIEQDKFEMTEKDNHEETEKQVKPITRDASNGIGIEESVILKNTKLLKTSDTVETSNTHLRVLTDDIPVNIGEESPAKQSLSEFLVIPKTPIKKGCKNQDHRSFVLTSKAWEDEELKKQNKKTEEIQAKENKKQQRLKIAEEKRLMVQQKKADNLKKKAIKIESETYKHAKRNKEKPKIIQNILIKPANENISNEDLNIDKDVTKQETYTDKQGSQNKNITDEETSETSQKINKQEKNKGKHTKPLTSTQILNILLQDGDSEGPMTVLNNSANHCTTMPMTIHLGQKL
ncbi:unnamed protein product [Diatraea saccharalis]|uniref:Uncharacterized protein n=1 Tax=Diatraea saccharalis TaxID=40085 RepID=A0A9N9QT13_9NEOP|nr:unnamed protein product [Diatraea saccharalis]